MQLRINKATKPLQFIKRQYNNPFANSKRIMEETPIESQAESLSSDVTATSNDGIANYNNNNFISSSPSNESDKNSFVGEVKLADSNSEASSSPPIESAPVELNAPVEKENNNNALNDVKAELPVEAMETPSKEEIFINTSPLDNSDIDQPAKDGGQGEHEDEIENGVESEAVEGAETIIADVVHSITPEPVDEPVETPAAVIVYPPKQTPSPNNDNGKVNANDINHDVNDNDNVVKTPPPTKKPMNPRPRSAKTIRTTPIPLPPKTPPNTAVKAKKYSQERPGTTPSPWKTPRKSSSGGGSFEEFLARMETDLARRVENKRRIRQHLEDTEKKECTFSPRLVTAAKKGGRSEE
ncbi:hypothetical protein ACHAXS_004130 [Conticribra weissflogii]